VAERLLLVGMMGAGKSTVARLAATRLGWNWVDTDDEVEAAGGATVAAIFARHGEPHFRQEETRAIDAVLRRSGPLVVSVGGGAVLDQGNRQRLQSAGTVVWLRARPETLVERVGHGADRPLLAGDGSADRAEVVRRLDLERRPFYAEVAHRVVDVDGLDAPTVAEQVLDRVALGAPGRRARS
jgi:shikimate kinase